MYSGVRTAATKVISDTSKAILDYLTQRTDYTIGTRADGADAAIVGEVEGSEADSVPVREEDAGRLQPWLSGEAGPIPKMIIYRTWIRVEAWLTGPGSSSAIEIFYVLRTDRRSFEPVPLFEAHDHGLVFLRKMRTSLPYSSYVSPQGYQLATEEKGMEQFQVKDYDDQGRLYVRDHTAAVQESIAAVRWYVALPKNDDEKLNAELFKALSSANRRIIRHAIRALARRRAPGCGGRFHEMLDSTSGELHDRLILGLWVLGDQDASTEALEKMFREEGKAAVLGRWGLQYSTTDTGQPTAPLFGPDPSEMKGD